MTIDRDAANPDLRNPKPGTRNLEPELEVRRLTPDAADMECGGPTPPWIPAERATRPTVERPDEDRPGRGQARPPCPGTWNPKPRTRPPCPQIAQMAAEPAQEQAKRMEPQMDTDEHG